MRHSLSELVLKQFNFSWLKLGRILVILQLWLGVELSLAVQHIHLTQRWSKVTIERLEVIKSGSDQNVTAVNLKYVVICDTFRCSGQ